MKSIKTYMTFLAILLLSSFNGWSQDMSAGVKAGPNFHTVYGTSSSGGMRVGLHLGGFMQFGISDKLALRPELLYSLEGSRTTVAGSVAKVNFNYLNIPIMGRFLLDGPYFEFGPSIGFLLGGNNVFTNPGGDKEKRELDMEQFNTMELALEFGGGYELENGLDIGLRIDLGFSGLQDFSDAPSGAGTENINNFGIRLSGAYSF